MKAIYELSQKTYFWLIGILYFMLMEGIALYYQYVLQFFPCALCVQVRAWVAVSYTHLPLPTNREV